MCVCVLEVGRGVREVELRIQDQWDNLEVLTCIIRIREGRRSKTVNGTVEKYERIEKNAKNFPKLVTGIKILI